MVLRWLALAILGIEFLIRRFKSKQHKNETPESRDEEERIREAVDGVAGL